MGRRTNSLKGINEKNITLAVATIIRGMTYHEAGAKHCVKRNTLHTPVTSPPRKRIMTLALTNKEEDLLVSFLIKFAKRGVRLIQGHFLEAVNILVNDMDHTRRFVLPFRHGVPGRALLRGFRERHKDKFSFAKPVRQGAIRFSQVHADVLTTHFASLEKLIREDDLDSNRIFNLDESGITPDFHMYGITSAKRFMPRSGCRDLCTPEFRNLNRVTLVLIISSSGACALTLFVFKGLRLPHRTIVKDGHIVLGSDANIGRSGFIHTSKGSVVTSSKALELARMKHAADVKTFKENAAKEARRAAKQDGRARAAAREAHNFHNYRTRRRAAMAVMCFEEYTASVRSLTERRAVARMRTNRRNQG